MIQIWGIFFLTISVTIVTIPLIKRAGKSIIGDIFTLDPVETVAGALTTARFSVYNALVGVNNPEQQPQAQQSQGVIEGGAQGEAQG